MGEFTIELKDLWFFSFHGLYEEEKKTGGEFLVNVFVKTHSLKQVNSIEETINYADLYDLVKAEMNVPRDLLETLAQSIAEKIHQAFPSIKETSIRITKKNPPIAGVSGQMAVTYSEKY
jgi:dihydroneopterin aldolase